MDPIKGTPAYWMKFMKDVKQLGIPAFSLKLSCADLEYELFSTVNKINGIERKYF